MFKKEKIGIIGLGFVGSAINASYQDLYGLIDLVKIDLDPSKGTTHSYSDLEDCSAIFICVPSPQKEDGTCDSRPLISTLDNIKNYSENFKGVIISKVTAPPNIYTELQKEFPNLVHAPEFLTAANATEDYINGKFSIIGGSVKAYMNEAERVIKLGQPNLKKIEFCSIGEAALVKYTVNTFLATKVVFMNEMAKLAETSGLDWNTVRKLILLDEERMGNSHTQVPGPDGNYGFGGFCFPKDTSALLKYAESLNVSMNVLDATVKKNLMLRLTDSK